MSRMLFIMVGVWILFIWSMLVLCGSVSCNTVDGAMEYIVVIYVMRQG